MATVAIRYLVPDEKAKEFVDAVLDTAATNAEYIFYTLGITNKKHVSVPVEFSWTYENHTEVSGIGDGSMDICEDGFGCECELEEEI